jgi:hypothetical protein
MPLLPARARLGLVCAVADGARGHRPREHHRALGSRDLELHIPKPEEHKPRRIAIAVTGDEQTAIEA